MTCSKILEDSGGFIKKKISFVTEEGDREGLETGELGDRGTG
jgi:hypothetical protein